MAISKQYEEDWMYTWTDGRHPQDRPEQCFYCRELVNPPAIVWRGPHEIYLHPHCANDFIIRLACDIHEFQCKGK